MRIFNTMAAHAIPFIPRALIRKISRRYIAGDSLADAVERVRNLNAQGFTATLDVLGETVSSSSEAEATAAEYLRVIDVIQTQGLEAGISIKPSALGLLIAPDTCERLVEQIVDTAAAQGIFVCIDMEDADCTQKEIDLFVRVAATRANVGLALQAYLKRSDRDIVSLLNAKHTLRICKGIYAEHPSHLIEGACEDRSRINAPFIRYVSRCFRANAFVSIATHDAALIDAIVALVHHDEVDRTRFEFQMLLGVCEPLRNKLLSMGFRVCIYVPYGEDWYGYSIRRIKENPRIAGHVIKATLSRA
ncbi:L-proline dehydrogenase [Burkholderia sp. WAC0059]|uniref:proline dehydrogenase family protein n=1 Tax=Burkholderia sp. WAC0059 TaxID=2066022 RepID=UPI000C7F3E0E|nr:proline dehydrogenase family protein [Burkholderia sp. WAC0059]PLZ02602.1 L-proline dehydrogenase [Burkholderia sp. WAC0059]